MEQRQKELYISLLIGAFCIFVYFFRIKNYLLMDVFFEAKFAASALGMNGFSDIFVPKLNGQPFFEAGPFYYFILNLSALIFRRFSEFSVRFPSVVFAFSTVILTYFLTQRMVNKKFAIVATLTSLSSVIFIIFSSLSSPHMIAACFTVISILLAFTPLFINHEGHKKYYFFGFWLFSILAVLTNGLSSIWLPLIVVIPMYIVFKRSKDFFNVYHFLPGFMIFISGILCWLYCSYKISGSEYVLDIVAYSKPRLFVNTEISGYKHFLKYFALYFSVGFLPWIFSFLTILVSGPKKVISEWIAKKNSNEKYAFNNGRKFLTLSLWAFICAISLYLIFGISDFPRLITTIFFACLVSSYYWYKQIFDNQHNKAIFVPSLLFYCTLIGFAIFSVIAYFFVTPIQKTYVESLMTPIISLTLLVAIPGLIAILLKRKVLNFSMHVILSILLFFVSTGLLYNYVNSFGANDLVNFSIKAKDDGTHLVTYDVDNKYAMTYYFANPVEFNPIMSAEEIFAKYGDTRDVYMVLKLSDLNYFDKFFVYEIVASGKQYCEITNIKYLPTDEVKADPEIEPNKAQ